MDKKQNRLRRARKTRAKIRELEVPRLSVHRTAQHIHAQVIGPDGGTVLASASTISNDLRSAVKQTGNVSGAVVVGNAIAVQAYPAGVTKAASHRSCFRYPGRVDALPVSARTIGFDF